MGIGAKVTRSLLLDIAKHAVTFNDSPFAGSTLCILSGKPIIDRNFIGRYWQAKLFFRRTNYGNKARSLEFNLITEEKISFHLDNLSRALNRGSLNEDCVENVDEIHFFYDIDDRSCLSSRGSTSVNYLDVVSGTMGMTVVLRVTGGYNARITSPFSFSRIARRAIQYGVLLIIYLGCLIAQNGMDGWILNVFSNG